MFGTPRNPFAVDLPPVHMPPPINMPQRPMAAAVQAGPKKTPVWKDILGAVLDLVGSAAGGQPAYWPMKMKLREKLEEEERANRPKVEKVGDSVGILDPVTGSFTPTYTPPAKPEGPTAFQRDYEFVKSVDPATAEQMLRNRGLKTATIYNPETGNYELRLIGGQDAPPPRLKAPPPDAIPLPGGAGSGPRGFR